MSDPDQDDPRLRKNPGHYIKNPKGYRISSEQARADEIVKQYLDAEKKEQEKGKVFEDSAEKISKMATDANETSEILSAMNKNLKERKSKIRDIMNLGQPLSNPFELINAEPQSNSRNNNSKNKIRHIPQDSRFIKQYQKDVKSTPQNIDPATKLNKIPDARIHQIAESSKTNLQEKRILSEIQKLYSENQSLRNELRNAKLEIESEKTNALKSELENVKSVLGYLKPERDTLKLELRELRTKVEKFEEVHEEIRTKKREGQYEYDDLKLKIRRLEKEYDEKKEELRRLS